MKTFARILAALTAILICLAPEADAQRTTRRIRHTPADKHTSADSRRDSVAVDPRDSIFTVSGYEKTLRSRHETFFITNRGDSAVRAIALTIDYLDMNGHRLDRRNITVDITLPPGETRRADITAWDRQQAMYYYLSPAPRRSTTATPYKVRVSVTHIIH